MKKNKFNLLIIIIWGIIISGCFETKEERDNRVDKQLSIDNNFENKMVQDFIIEYEKTKLIKSELDDPPAEMVAIKEEQLIKSKNTLLNLNNILKKNDSVIFSKFATEFKKKYPNENTSEVNSIYKKYMDFLKTQKNKAENEIKVIEEHL
jgi:hypothetical protein